jgi:hypothetical protein
MPSNAACPPGNCRRSGAAAHRRGCRRGTARDFLTDGLNTQNRWTTKAVDIDARTKVVCDNIKKARIQIYTIRVMEGNQSLLQGCASAPSMYYNVTQASQLQPVFADIAKSLYQLRITK